MDLTERVIRFLETNPELSVECISATDDGSPILSVISLSTDEHLHLTLRKL